MSNGLARRCSNPGGCERRCMSWHVRGATVPYTRSYAVHSRGASSTQLRDSSIWSPFWRAVEQTNVQWDSI